MESEATAAASTSAGVGGPTPRNGGVVSSATNSAAYHHHHHRSIIDNNSNYKNKNDACVLLVNPAASSSSSSSSDRSTLRRSKTPDGATGARKIALSEDGRSHAVRSPAVDRPGAIGCGGGGDEKAVNGCLRSPRSTPAGHDGTEVAVSAAVAATVGGGGSCRTSKRVTFDRHDVCGGSVTVPEASSSSWPGSSSPRRISRDGMTDAEAGGPPPTCSRTPAVDGCALKSPAMPKGPASSSSVSSSSRQDQTKTGCFGCISRKNSSKSTPTGRPKC